MIEVKISRYRVEAKGHAGFADFGQDIVCAGMSTIFATTAEMMLRMQRDCETRGDLATVQLERGNVLLEFEPMPEARDKADWLWQFLEAGCRLIAESYPQYVVITEA